MIQIQVYVSKYSYKLSRIYEQSYLSEIQR